MINIFCVIQELKLKKENEGKNKCLEVYTWNSGSRDNYKTHYSYQWSKERFKRPIKKAYKIAIHKSYRENGKVKKKQWVIGTWEHYSLIEYGFDLWKIDDKFKEMEITEDELYDLIYVKLEPLIDKIAQEYHNTEEYKIYQENLNIIEIYNKAKNEFDKIYGAGTYECCYDVFGELRNEEELIKIKLEYKENKKQEEEYRKQYYENYYNSKSSYQNISYSNYNEEDKKFLKKFYKKLAFEFHPDRNDNNSESTKAMKVINKLKDEWNV